MVSTRHQTRLKQSELGGAGDTDSLEDRRSTDSQSKERMARKRVENTEPVEESEKKEPNDKPEEEEIEHSSTCDHNTKKESRVKEYLKGFGKRVVLCTILVIIFRSVWPKVQPYVWPEDPTKEGKLYVLTEKSFRGQVSRGDHFVMMYAPWCGHCQQLKPTWEKLAKSPGVSGVKIAKVDCTANESLCKTYQVHGYPTLLYFRNGEKIDKHDGEKSLQGLKNYLKKMKESRPKKTKSKKSEL